MFDRDHSGLRFDYDFNYDCCPVRQRRTLHGIQIQFKETQYSSFILQTLVNYISMHNAYLYMYMRRQVGWQPQFDVTGEIEQIYDNQWLLGKTDDLPLKHQTGVANLAYALIHIFSLMYRTADPRHFVYDPDQQNCHKY